jgi:hypothetical protein
VEVTSFSQVCFNDDVFTEIALKSIGGNGVKNCRGT